MQIGAGKAKPCQLIAGHRAQSRVNMPSMAEPCQCIAAIEEEPEHFPELLDCQRSRPYSLPMSTGPQFTTALTPVSGFHEATLDKYMRDLRNADVVPSSGKGGGKAAVHLDHHHAASIILSMAAMGPGGAADAVRRLATLEWEQPFEGEICGLWANLAAILSTLASIVFHGDSLLEADETDNWELTVCLDPLMAWMSWTQDGKEVRRHFTDPQSTMPSNLHPQEMHRGVRRLTVITVSVLNVAAELCADTLAHQARQIPTPPSPSGSAVPNADLKNESAGGVPTPPAPQCDPNRAQAHGSKTLTSPETMEKREKSQPSPARGRVTSCSSRGSSRLSSNVPTPSSRRPRHHGSPENPALASFT